MCLLLVYGNQSGKISTSTQSALVFLAAMERKTGAKKQKK